MKVIRSAAALLLAATLLSACATKPAAQLYEGRYFYHFEASTFTPKGGSEVWCVDAAEMKVARLTEADAPSPFGGSWGWADVVVRGQLSQEGSYCNMGASPRLLRVHEVVQVVRMRPGDP